MGTNYNISELFKYLFKEQFDSNLFEIDKRIPMTSALTVSASTPISLPEYDKDLFLGKWYKSIRSEIEQNINREILSVKPIETMYIDVRGGNNEVVFEDIRISKIMESHIIANGPIFVLTNSKIASYLTYTNTYRPIDTQTKSVSHFESHGKIVNSNLLINSYEEYDSMSMHYIHKPIKINFEFLQSNEELTSSFMPRIRINFRMGYDASIRKVIFITDENAVQYKEFIRNDNIKKIME